MDHSQRHGSEVNKVAKSDSCDRLSELPDSLIITILSLLEMRDVVRTTILSKFWKNRWTRVPCLDFGYYSFVLPEHQRFVNGALARWQGPKVLKFTITFPYYCPKANALDPWLLFAIEKQVEELNLVIKGFRTEDSEYCPPQSLYSCSSITKLSLSYFKFIIEENVQWDRLKSLRIVSVNSLSADAMNRILRGAPHLEELFLWIEEISENFNIRSTSLKTLYISREVYCPEITNVCSGAELRIWAPNLSSLEIHAQFYGSCFLYVPSLTKALLYIHDYECLYERDFGGLSRIEMFNQVFQSVRHVENITLSPWCSKFLVYMKRKKDMVVQFSNAKFLNMYQGDELAHEMLDVEMFPKLMILTAKSYAQESYSLMSKITPSLCHLKTIEISVSVNYTSSDPSIFQVIQILLKNAHVLEKMVLRLERNLIVLGIPHGVDRGDEQEESQKMFDLAEEKVMSMLRSSSSTAEVIVIRHL